MNLLSKFAKVKEVSFYESLPSEDKVFFEKAFALFNTQLSENIFLENHFLAAKKDITQERSEYLITNVISACKESRRNIYSAFVSSVLEYFKGKYIKVAAISYDRYKDFTADSFKEMVLSQLETCYGANLTVTGFNNLKKQFNGLCYGYSYNKGRVLRAKITGAKMSIEDFSYYDTLWGDKYNFNYAENRVSTLLKCLYYYQHNDLGQFTIEDDLWRLGSKIDFKKQYNVGDTFSLKFYKNHKTDITFKDSKSAKEFFTLFELDKCLE